MEIEEEISLRTAIEYCIENNDSKKATNRVIEYIKDSLKAQMEQFDLYIVNRSKPSKDEQVLSDEETDLLLTAYYQTVVDIDKALDYEQSIEDE